MGKRIFLFKTESGSEYLVVLTPRTPEIFGLSLLVQLVGGSRRLEGRGYTLSLPQVGRHFQVYREGKGGYLRTSIIAEVREI